MTGWEKCEHLKKIRKTIADANGIPYEIEECEHLESCIGTCPKCDEEAEYINRALTYRAKAGKKIVVDGLLGDLFQGDGESESRKSPHVNRIANDSRTRRERDKHCDKDETCVREMADGGIDIESDIVDSEENENEDIACGGINLLDDIVDEELPFN